ncbi:stalk domain-containing protein [Cohnella sp. CFH 77786]|uniref:stalk domain-containing protein n=1 Tax=Cohnella sp. CFH 77786 TaxID=2662265 RepID=UPI001C60D04E|nr:stalk domain-containing protein [Cohnella sp. CFH 77786]
MTKMKRYARALAFAIACLLAIPAWAHAAALTVTVDGKTVKWPKAPVKSGTTVLVDAKTLLPLLGVSYSYDKTKKKLTAKAEGNTLILTAGSKSALLNGEKIALSAAPAATSGGIDIPGDAAARSFGGEAVWATSAKYDIMGKKKWTAVVSGQVLPIVRKLVDYQEKEDKEGIQSLLNLEEEGVSEWYEAEMLSYDAYERDLNLKSAKVTTVGPDYAIVEGVLGDSLLEGPYELDKDLTMQYMLEKVEGKWIFSYIAALKVDYLIPDEPEGAAEYRDGVNEFVEGLTDALNREDAEAYASLMDPSIAESEKSRIQDFFDEQEQETEAYDVQIVHLGDDGAVYIVLYETVTSLADPDEDPWDSQTVYMLMPQEDGKLRSADAYNLVFEQV